MQIYIQHLNINIEPLSEDIQSFGTWNNTKHIKVPHSKLNPKIITFFKNHNLFPRVVEIFYTPTMAKRYVHIDEYPGGDYIKLNWQVGGKNSLMRWYTINDNVISKEPLTTEINTKYIRFEPDEVNLAFKSKIGYPSIVQVGVPHDIINTHEPRYVLSIVPVHFKTGKRVTMTEAISIFNKFIVDI